MKKMLATILNRKLGAALRIIEINNISDKKQTEGIVIYILFAFCKLLNV
jgi:hypothetical protein